MLMSTKCQVIRPDEIKSPVINCEQRVVLLRPFVGTEISQLGEMVSLYSQCRHHQVVVVVTIDGDPISVSSLPSRHEWHTGQIWLSCWWSISQHLNNSSTWPHDGSYVAGSLMKMIIQVDILYSRKREKIQNFRFLTLFNTLNIFLVLNTQI